MDDIDINIALVSFYSAFGDLAKNFSQMEKWIVKAGKKGVRIICFPELSLTGYGVDESVYRFAEPVLCKWTSRLSKISKKCNIIILFGMLEKENSSIYISHVVLFPDGRVRVYRKLYLSPPEKKIFSQGESVVVFKDSGFVFGIQLCYDMHFPELSTQMAIKGADFIFAPHASPKGSSLDKFNSWMRHMPARAYDNAVYILSCNLSGENKNKLRFPGLSLAINPSGRLIVSNTTGDESMLIVKIDRADIDCVRKHKMRYFLPNRRDDLYLKKSN